MFKFIKKLIGKLFKLFFGFILLIVVLGIVLPTSSNKEKSSSTKETNAVKMVKQEADRETEKEIKNQELPKTETEGKEPEKAETEKTETEKNRAEKNEAEDKATEKSEETAEHQTEEGASLRLVKDGDSKIEPSSEAETQIAKKIIQQSEVTAPSTERQSVKEETEAPAFVEVRRGDKGDSVKEVQSILIALGYLASTPDGSYGPKTEQAVVNFQKAAGIEASGRIDQTTYAALISDSAPEKETEATKDVPREPMLESSNTSRMYATANVNVRSGPSADTEKLGTIIKGDSVEAGKAENGWTVIIYSSGVGYVSSQYLSSSAPVLALTPETSAASSNDSVSRSPSEPMVWISGSGSKYHSRSSCSNMNNPWQVTRSEAESMGRTPCKKCY